ncbi:MAG TPA: hypothetical protein VN047_05705 [Sphingopyxis sp.]|uniref:hypothetical protein n=1 Tax=Sphingopyxis sp. TaxID=1908224 RepID=UPI002CB6E1E7|nr:hypothetical protein [Sphingopyxis sp.]HWW56369.1 hypothetical protein [Sphingopyxis sp.]
MATLSIWETVRSTSGLPVLRLDDRTNYQSVTFTGTAAASAAFDVDTSIITVLASANCAIRVGSNNPVAIVTDYPLTAGTLLDLEVQPGQKISAITV